MNRRQKHDRQRAKRRDKQAAKRSGGQTVVPSTAFARCPGCDFGHRGSRACSGDGLYGEARAHHDELVAERTPHYHMDCSACGLQEIVFNQ